MIKFSKKDKRLFAEMPLQLQHLICHGKDYGNLFDLIKRDYYNCLHHAPMNYTGSIKNENNQL
jgi:hypothetical protein